MTKEYPDADGLTTVEWLEFFLEHVPEMQIQHVMTLLKSLNHESRRRIRSDEALAILYQVKLKPHGADNGSVRKAMRYASDQYALLDDKAMEKLIDEWGEQYG